MRGLTTLERAILIRRRDNAPRQVFYRWDPEWSVHANLRRLGRLRGDTITLIDGSVTVRNYITDMGLLALRVCPVEDH